MKQGNGKCMVKVTKGAIGECNPQGSQTWHKKSWRWFIAQFLL